MFVPKRVRCFLATNSHGGRTYGGVYFDIRGASYIVAVAEPEGCLLGARMQPCPAGLYAKTRADVQRKRSLTLDLPRSVWWLETRLHTLAASAINVCAASVSLCTPGHTMVKPAQ